MQIDCVSLSLTFSDLALWLSPLTFVWLSLISYSLLCVCLSTGYQSHCLQGEAVLSWGLASCLNLMKNSAGSSSRCIIHGDPDHHAHTKTGTNGPPDSSSLKFKETAHWVENKPCLNSLSFPSHLPKGGPDFIIFFEIFASLLLIAFASLSVSVVISTW